MCIIPPAMDTMSLNSEEEAMKDKFYYKDGTTSSKYDSSKEVHRVDGPAIEHTNGAKHWATDDKRHRIDGPAIEWADGSKYWYVDDQHYTEKEFKRLIKEVKQLPKVLRLIDPREWVRKL